MPERKKKGKMTVREAGSKGGKSTSKKYGHDFYVKIGKKGGGRVRELKGVRHVLVFKNDGGKAGATVA
ncbi:hypothetical protein M1307_00210, partial [Patescibacteria group bacterium]|nr:hypothetical protein [Patescibacteria group bacterium]